MTRLRTIFVLALGLLALPCAIRAQSEQSWVIEPLTGQGWVEADLATGIATATNGVIVRYGGAVLTAEKVTVDQRTGVVIADGSVRVQRDEQIWVSEHLRYNFQTHQMEADQFRTGQTPAFGAGRGLHGETTNRVYFATNAIITSDDVAKPALKVRARRIKIVPGRKIEAYDAVFYVGEVPVFYFPFYSRNLGDRANNFNFTPGYRSMFGPYLLGNYTWFLNQQLDGVARLDYREKRGVGLGPDFNYHLGRWGEGTLKYYYTYDQDPGADQLDVPIPNNRQRVYFAYQAAPDTNVAVKALVRYQSDQAVTRDFFESEYAQNSQPNTFVEVNKFWQNFSLDTYVQPRVNDFLQTVERLPDVRLTAYRQQLGASPLFYESESSASYNRQLWAVDAGSNGPPPGLNYSAARADTFQQVLLPETLFGWLNVIPRAGGRFTYYSAATGPGAKTDEVNRGVFNTGAEVSFKASRLWPGAQSTLLEADGLRHIVEPSANYAFVPTPNAVGTNVVPQFDSELASLVQLPIEFPDYNAIDSIDSQNVIRWGLQNNLQTKRRGQIVNLLQWDLYADWYLRPQPGQTTFGDLYSHLTLKPRSWLTLESLLRYDVSDGYWRLAAHALTLQPNNVWNWSLGQYYLRDDLTGSPTELGTGNNLYTSTFLYRLNENWGLRMSQRFDVRYSRLQQQAYTVYRDLRSWTAALTFIVSENSNGVQDYTVAFTFSLKAIPRFGLGADAASPYSLLSR